MNRILSLNTPELREEALDRACIALHQGELVAFPTESFYGLAADTRRQDAIERLFAAKGRSPDQPVLLLLPSRESVTLYAVRIPPAAHALMERFWPGPLTLVFQAASHVNPLLTAGTSTIGLRLSSHPVALDLARRMGAAITGTSANPSGRPPACSAARAAECLGPEVTWILDHGPTPGGKGSTILDVTVDPPAVLRQGQVSREALYVCLQG